MTVYLLRRLGWAVVTLLIFVAVVFVGLQLLLPFDFSTQFAFGGRGDDYYAMRESLGLDRPLLARAGLYVLGLAQGDLGMSYTGEPVAAIIGRSLPFTILVFAVGGILAYVLGEWLGRVAAWHRSRAVGSATTTASVLLSTTFPPLLVFVMTYFLTMPFYELRFALGLPSDSLEVWRSTYLTQLQVLTLVAVSVLGAVIVAFALRAYARRWDLRLLAALALPVTVTAALIGVALTGAGTEALDLMFRGTAGVNVGRGSPFLAMIAFIILGFGEVAILMRTGMAEESSEDYVKTAFAKGLPGRVVRDRHVARNAMLPVLTRLFVGIPYILTALIIIEQQLEVGGLSQTFFEAVGTADTPVVLGVVVVVGIIGLVLRLLMDILVAVLDPRVRTAAMA
ncbi:MAG TPA: ABC transporter permease [Acidimicrobiia bacterium]|jgi:peptide/nickel transport system permease protein|nr:ABC transporter permease [Acidimicrobiia bacterium]